MSTTHTHTLSLHDALPISIDRVQLGRIARAVALDDADRPGVRPLRCPECRERRGDAAMVRMDALAPGDRKSTRLNSSHRCISYADFCVKKKRQLNLCIHCT